MKRIGIARLGLASASLLIVALALPARAEEGELIKNFLGSIGVISPDKEAIDYRERAPLVLPPRMDLREPAAPKSAEARNPQWPNDPDVAARRRQAAEDSTPVGDTELRRTNRGSARLTIEEMRAGRQAGASVPMAPVTRNESNWIHPDVLRAQHQQTASTQTADDGTRRSLTDPPSAYRRSATGEPIKGSFEAPKRVDESDPKMFRREQMLRN